MSNTPIAHDTFAAAAKARDAKATRSKSARRAKLVETYGERPATLALIDEILVIDAEIAGTQKGKENTRIERRRERRLWLERRDDVIKKLDDAHAARLANDGPVKTTVIERRHPSVPLATLVNAAKVQLAFVESLSSYAEIERYEALLDKVHGPDWLDDFRELLERHAADWLSTFDARCPARLDAEPAS